MKLIGACAAVAVLLSCGAALKWDDVVVKPKLRQLLKQAMKDPDSMQYRGEIVTRNGTNLCGEFNAKNGFGAYTGFKRFIAEPNRFAVEGDPLDDWNRGDSSAGTKRIDAELAVMKLLGPDAAPERVRLTTDGLLFDDLWQDRCQPGA